MKETRIQSVQALLKKKANAEITCDEATDYIRRLVNILKVLAEIKAGDRDYPSSGALSELEGGLSHAC